MIFHKCLSDSKLLQVSRTLLNILADLNNAVIWMVSTRPLISKSYNPFINLLVTVPRAPITTGIKITFMFHSFFNSLARLRYLSFFLLSFSFTLWSAGTAKSATWQVFFFFFLLIIMRSGRLAKIRWLVCISKSHQSLCFSFSRTAAGLCIYYLFLWSNVDFLQNSQWITLPTQSCSILYSFCANLLYSFMWLIVSSLLPHHFHLLHCCVLSIIALIWLVLIALFCITITRDSVSLLRFPFLSHVHVFSCKILLICRLKRLLSCFSSHFYFLVIVVPLVLV